MDSLLTAPIMEAIQALRYEGKLYIIAKEIDHIVNCVVRMPNVLLEQYDGTSIFESFAIPGFIDRSREGVDLNNFFNTYKKNYTIEDRQKWEADHIHSINFFVKYGQIAEEAWKNYQSFSKVWWVSFQDLSSH